MQKKIKIIFLVSFASIFIMLLSCTINIKNGTDLLKKMQSTYNQKWFKEIAFEQKSIFYKNDSIYKTQLWQEIYQFPGKLNIKFDSISSSTGYLFANDTLTVFNKGKIKSQIRRIHDLVVLSMDVYSQDIKKTISQLNELGYDLNKIHTNIWNGKEVYVVGAEKGDTISKQFWIEKERLIFVRSLMLLKGNYVETIFDDYIKFNDSWVEQTVTFKYDNKIVMKEVYSNIRKPEITDSNIFNPDNFINSKW